jgi:hypothetical protein
LKYNQPFDQPSNPNAPYVDGNPAAGIQGSIVPAASIEFPQRELVNFSLLNSLTPSNADLLQLSKAVQAGMVNYGVDQGQPNAIYITPVVPVAAYTVGLRFVIKMGFGNYGAVTLNVNGLGNVPVIHTNLTPLLAYELVAGQLIEVAYDGAQFQAIGGVSGSGAVMMTAPQALYVNPTTGSDTLYDGTAAEPVGAHGGPFQTIDKALATMSKYNLGGWTFVIYLANGTYTKATSIACPLPNGSGTVQIIGNDSVPDQCNVFNTGQGSCFQLFAGGNYLFRGMAFRATAPAQYQDEGHGVWAMFGTTLNIADCSWNSVPSCHVLSGANATIFYGGNMNINGPAPGAHQSAYTNGVVLGGIGAPTDPNLNVTAPVTLGAFAEASDGGTIWSIWNSMTGKANVSGPRYIATGNGVINSGGRGTTALPGSTVGTLATGGQYV